MEGGGELMSPGPGCCDPQVEATAAAGETGGDVQDPVAEFLGFGGSQLAVQQQDAGPGQKVDGREAGLEPGGVRGEW